MGDSGDGHCNTYELPRLKRLDLHLLIVTLSEYAIAAWNPGRLGKLLSKDGGNGWVSAVSRRLKGAPHDTNATHIRPALV